MKKAAIDLGTNTCLLLLAEIENSVITHVLGDFAQIVRLGEGVNQTRRLSVAAMDRTMACLKNYAIHVKAAGIDPHNVMCVATSQARDAQNSEAFFSQVFQLTGFRFQILSGEEEAAASFKGALLPGMDPAQCTVIDIGGGSTEVVSAHAGYSLKLGAVRFTEQFLKSDPVSDDEFWACQAAIDQEMKSLPIGLIQGIKGQSFVAVAGTATTLATWYLGLTEFQAKRVDGLVLQRGDIHRAVEELKWRTVAERKQLSGIDLLRADVILAGALILWRALEIFDISHCTVSTRGLRYGVLFTS